MILADLIESNNYNSNLYLNTYCGSYASDDNKLHIILKHDENFQNYADNLDEAKIKYEYGQYSITELLNTLKIISSVHSKYDIALSGINEKDNRIHIAFAQGNKLDELITYLKEKDIDVDCLVFNENQDYATFAKGYQSAGQIICSSSRYESVGFNEKKTSTGLYGLVTAGHLHSSNTTYSTRSGSLIGYDNASCWHFGDNCDALFVPFVSGENWSPTASYIMYRDNYTPEVQGHITGKGSVLLGYNVVKYGSSLFRTTGKYEQTNNTITIWDNQSQRYYTITDMFIVSTDCAGGDSGGPIGREAVDGASKKLVIGGTTCCNIGSNETGGIKINNILNQLGLTLYV